MYFPMAHHEKVIKVHKVQLRNTLVCSGGFGANYIFHTTPEVPFCSSALPLMKKEWL